MTYKMKNTYDKLDRYDHKIISELDINARIAASAISRKIRLPKETVNFRVKRLLKRDYIKNFYTLINGSTCGYQYYKIFIKFNNMTKNLEEEVKDFLLAEKSCANLRISDGFFDICFVSMHKNPEDLKQFMHRFHTKFGRNILLRSMNQIISSYKFSQKFFPQSKEIRNKIYYGRTSDYNLDEIDKKVIRILSIQARTKLIDMSSQLNEDPKVIKYHMKKLEKDGIIIGYFTALNLEILHKSLVQIDISLKDPTKIHLILDYFQKTNAGTFASEMLGRYDLTIEIYIDDDNQLRNIIQKFKETFSYNIMFYDLSRIYQEFVVNWSPFDALKK